MMSGRRDCQEIFELRLEGDLGAEDQRAVELHLEQCAECRSEYGEMARLMGLLRSDEIPELSADRIQALEETALSQAAAAPDEPSPLPASRPEALPAWARVSVGILAAAGVAALVTAAVIFFSRPSDRARESRETKTGRPKVARKARPTPAPTPGPELPSPVAKAARGAVAVRPAGPGMPAFGDRPVLNRGTQIETLGSKSAVLLAAAGHGLELQIGPETVLRRMDDPGWAFRIERGSVQVDLARAAYRRRLAVLTPRGTVSVTGTRFLVTVRTNRVSVTVFRGNVTYHRSGRSALNLARGRKMVDEPGGARVSASTDAPPSWLLGQAVAVAAVPAPGETRPGPKDCRTGRIRSLLKKGSARRALALIRACKTERGTKAVDMATLEAEALLAAGRVRSAVRAYHRIARRYKGSRASQNALFAAGQLEMTRLRQKKRALATFKKYLARYPQGRYRSDVRRLIRLLEKRPDGTK